MKTTTERDAIRPLASLAAPFQQLSWRIFSHQEQPYLQFVPGGGAFKLVVIALICSGVLYASETTSPMTSLQTLASVQKTPILTPFLMTNLV